MTNDPRRQELIEGLRRFGVLEGDFELKSGRQASWFIDTKRAICRPPYLALVAALALEVLDPRVVAVGGLTMGADPVAYAVAALAQEQGRALKAFSVRKEAKGYGQGGRVAGALDVGDAVCVVEDTPSRGTSLQAAVEAVVDAGGTVVQTLAVVDRGGTAARVVAPIPFVALLSAPDLGLPYDGGLPG